MNTPDAQGISLLMQYGADVNHRDADLSTALMHAVFHGSLPKTKVLIEAGADVNAVDNTGKTALLSATEGGHQETADLLLANGASKAST